MRYVGLIRSVEGEGLDLWEDRWLYMTGFVPMVEVDNSLDFWENDSAALHMVLQILEILQVGLGVHVGHHTLLYRMRVMLLHADPS